MAITGGAVLGGLLILLFLGGLIFADIIIALGINIVVILAVTLACVGISYAIITIIQSFKDGKIIYSIIFIAFIVGASLIPFERFYDGLLGYKLVTIFHRLTIVGLVSYIGYYIYLGMAETIEGKNFTVLCMGVAIIALIVTHFAVGIDSIMFERVPQTVAEHNENWYTKRETKNNNPREELELVLKKYKQNPSLEFSKDEISKYTHTMYNGIWCYTVEDNGDSYTVGMAYKDDMSFWSALTGAIFPNKNFGKVGNYKVDKTTFDITETLLENFVGGRDYGK